MHLIRGAGVAPPSRAKGPHFRQDFASAHLSVGTYCLAAGTVDDQRPHAVDELYVVVEGQAVLKAGAASAPVSPGDVAYVPAHEPHRFEDIASDLVLLVLFAPPYDSPAATTDEHG